MSRIFPMNPLAIISRMYALWADPSAAAFRRSTAVTLYSVSVTAAASLASIIAISASRRARGDSEGGHSNSGSVSPRFRFQSLQSEGATTSFTES